MSPLFVALALAGPVSPDAATTHLRRCDSPRAAVEDLVDAGLTVPLDDASDFRVVDTFRTPRSGGRLHKATDIMAPRGTPIFAIDDGVVTNVRWNRLGGRVIEQLDTTGCVGFYYAHLDSYAAGLKPGTVVHRGTLLGYVGTSGNTHGAAHLHFGTYFLGDRPGVFSWEQPVNPVSFLVPRDDS
jgi:murein DD-endopeptidase MepM/ murein hydrolase activator NlpD